MGTVRSRLNQAKRKLAEALLAHHDMASLAASRRDEVSELLEAGERGALAPVLAERWWPDAGVVWPGDDEAVDLVRHTIAGGSND